ncbi:hypothetical protein BX666DRAFT_1940822 [Dichotomocladium elegans]|nr:hypothetical protein BX666DRAFT_1940822 [Dichotomocladium elegans]
MTQAERSRFIRRRLGWLPGGKPHSALDEPAPVVSQRHGSTSIADLSVDTREPDSASFVTNILYKPCPPTILDIHRAYMWDILEELEKYPTP